MIRVTGLRWAPPAVQGLVRDIRVRWALEEAGLPYEVRLIGRDDQAAAWYRKEQPFGQVPVYEEDDLVLFESGAIVMHISEKSPKLCPSDAKGKARMRSWMFAAMNSIEPQITPLVNIELFNSTKDWAIAYKPVVLENVRNRFQKLSEWLGDREYLEDRFTGADLLMTAVFRALRHSDLLKEYPVLEAYRQRCEARPAFQKALKDQMEVFARNAPPAQN